MDETIPIMDQSVIRTFFWDGDPEQNTEPLLSREWIVANGLGGYASTTIAGVCTRKYHGLLIAALPAPAGRIVMMTGLGEEIAFPDGSVAELSAEQRGPGDIRLPGARFLRQFRLESGLPVWRYEVENFIIEKRIFFPHLQNSIYINYRLLGGAGSLRLRLRPLVHFRPLHAEASVSLPRPYILKAVGSQYEVGSGSELPPLRLYLHGRAAALILNGGQIRDVFYRIEHRRCYQAYDSLWNPGYFRVSISPGDDATLIASAESWNVIHALKPGEAFQSEIRRRRSLLATSQPKIQSGPAAELVLTADQFIIDPISRAADIARAHASAGRVRSVIAGYHWFTDWGRDTMIGLEGLALATGRFEEAGLILRTFAEYMRDGLIPTMFPEGKAEGLYHTADATLWFFHAIDRYVRITGDQEILDQLLPRLVEAVDHHMRGTRFGIGVDPDDGLLKQGAAGYPLTWMDAKAGDWVVTPRRGKAVEINALWYNALRNLAGWLREPDPEKSALLEAHADRVYESFNQRFWHEPGGHLHDVVDGENGDDPAFRPNQLFAVSLPHPVLDPGRWKQVVHAVQERLLTPYGLRSLAADHPDYKVIYYGDVCSRDAAYHQGTVWSWLIGPFIDAWIRVHPQDRTGARRFLEGLISHFDEACIGTISEVFDAETPFHPEGCVSQAWSVAEFLRSWINTSPLSILQR